MINWKYFFGASILVAGLLFKVGAPLVPIVIGMGTAALLTWYRLLRRAKH